MGFRAAVLACFQDYFRFSGRARRPEYWWFILFILVGGIVCVVLDRYLFGPDKIIGLEGLFDLVTICPALAVTWRRMHDIGRPGWQSLIPLPFLFLGVAVASDAKSMASILVGVAIVFSVVVLIWTIQSSQGGTNRFGPEMPKY